MPIYKRVNFTKTVIYCGLPPASANNTQRDWPHQKQNKRKQTKKRSMNKINTLLNGNFNEDTVFLLYMLPSNALNLGV